MVRDSFVNDVPQVALEEVDSGDVVPGEQGLGRKDDNLVFVLVSFTKLCVRLLHHLRVHAPELCEVSGVASSDLHVELLLHSLLDCWSDLSTHFGATAHELQVRRFVV